MWWPGLKEKRDTTIGEPVPYAQPPENIGPESSVEAWRADVITRRKSAKKLTRGARFIAGYVLLITLAGMTAWDRIVSGTVTTHHFRTSALLICS